MTASTETPNATPWSRLREAALTVEAPQELSAVPDPRRALAPSGFRVHSGAETSGPSPESPAATAPPSTATIRPAESPEPNRLRGSDSALRRQGRALIDFIRKPANLVFLIVLSVLVTGWWVELRPTSFLGGPATFIVVRGTSMLPTFHTGDFVLARSQTGYQVGEVVVYRVPRGNIGAGEEVIHRIVAGSSATGYTLEGDNNNTADPWQVPAADIVGREVAVLPGAGETLLVIRSPIFAGGVAAMVAISLVLFPPAWARRRRRTAAAGPAGRLDESPETAVGKRPPWYSGDWPPSPPPTAG
ncbi:MAG: signal peptidase I [Candidatus Dormiibacterota bacterium]